MWTTDEAVVVEASVDLDRWQQGFGELVLMIGSRFARVGPHRRAATLLQGLLAGMPRQTAGRSPSTLGRRRGGMQRLLSSAMIDTGGLRDDLRAYVVRHLGDPGAVLVIDKTGDLKNSTFAV